MQDLRLAIRSLRSTPIVTLVAALSLVLGIGANTAIFPRLALIGAIAGWLPAWRASRLDPAQVLRES